MRERFLKRIEHRSTMHEEEIAECLDLMLESGKLVENRFLKIRSPEDFVLSTEGSWKIPHNGFYRSRLDDFKKQKCCIS